MAPALVAAVLFVNGQDDATSDDAVVRRVAEAVLPTLLGWVPGPS